MAEKTINHVSDTASWVAYYRALETKRMDALFHDPLAEKLVGERGRAIAESMQATTKYVQWTVVMRTVMIDRFLRELTAKGIDTVVNLGAGLDTRPYRLEIPASVRWIEVDYPQLIDFKNSKLENEKPRVQLERVSIDLADRDKRREFFDRLGHLSENIVVLTEGVLPYLTEEAVAELAQDLRAQASIRYWIAEYLSPDTYRYLKAPKRQARMQNAPFRFFPLEWLAFFKKNGWKSHQLDYLADESLDSRRAFPLPLWAKILLRLTPKSASKRFRRQTGYVIFEPA